MCMMMNSVRVRCCVNCAPHLCAALHLLVCLRPHLTPFLRSVGRSPLHYAASNGRLHIARWLVGCGADVHMQDW